MKNDDIGEARGASKRALVWVPLFLAIALFAFADQAAEGAPAAEGGAGAAGDLAGIGITRLVAIITGIGALGMAAFSLVDAFKTLPGGGPSKLGYKDLEVVMNRFAAALDLALGPAAQAKGGKAEAEWRSVVRAHWINGRARGEQKAIVKSLIRLGLTSQTAANLATAGHVDATALAAVATKLEQGAPLTEVDLNLLGRLDASIEAQLDAAFDRADQRYRNGSRVLAGICAIALAFLATWALGWQSWQHALLVGLLAVPLAPIAKDLASSIQAAAGALRAAK